MGCCFQSSIEVKDFSSKVKDCSIKNSIEVYMAALLELVTVLLEYFDFFTVFMLTVMHQNNFWISVQKKCNLLSRNHPIIPEYSPIFFTTYFSQNYAGIIDTCVVLAFSSFEAVHTNYS